MIKSGFDSEYANLMAELGESGSGSGSGEPGRTLWAGPIPVTTSQQEAPAFLPGVRPEVWQTNNPPQQQQGYRPSSRLWWRYGGAPAGYGGAQYGGLRASLQLSSTATRLQLCSVLSRPIRQQQQIGTPSI